jgi:hypothetical protein
MAKKGKAVDYIKNNNEPEINEINNDLKNKNEDVIITNNNTTGDIVVDNTNGNVVWEEEIIPIKKKSINELNREELRQYKRTGILPTI